MMSFKSTGTLELDDVVTDQEERIRIFHEQAEAMRRRMRQMDRRTINPNSRFVLWWDQTIMIALLYTAFVTPFEVAFVPVESTASFVINRVVDVTFALDMVITFFMPFRTTPKAGGAWVYDNRAIACAYLKGWFTLDLVTTVPIGTIVKAASPSTTEGSTAIFRSLRVLRVVKLARLLRASRILKRWQDYIGLSFAMLSLIRFLILIIVLAHWLACAWGYIGSSSDGPTAANASSAEEAWVSYAHSDITWRTKAGVDSGNPFDVYAVALYVSLNNIFGSSCEINPANYFEFYMQSIMMIVGASVWAYVIGSACGLIATIDPALIEHRQTMDELNFFVYDQGMPTDLSVKLRTYFRNTLHLHRARRYERLLLEMSTRLRGDASYNMAKRSLRAVSYLSDPDLEPEFLSHVAVRFRLSVYSRLEQVPCVNLFIIERGVVAKNGTLGLARSCFGKDIIIAKETLRDLDDAIALTFVQTILITRSDIMELLPDFPRAMRVIAKHAVRIALMRLVVKAAELRRRDKIDRGTSLVEAMTKVEEFGSLNIGSLKAKSAMLLPRPPPSQGMKASYMTPTTAAASAIFGVDPMQMQHPPTADLFPSAPHVGGVGSLVSGGIGGATTVHHMRTPSPTPPIYGGAPSSVAILARANAADDAADPSSAPATTKAVRELTEAVALLTSHLGRVESKVDGLSSRMSATPAGGARLQKPRAPQKAVQHPRPARTLARAATTAVAAPNGIRSPASTAATTSAAEERLELREEGVASGATAASRSTPFDA